MVLESKESIKAWSKTYYIITKDHYQRLPDPTNANGLRDWKTHTMAYFDQFEDEDDENFTSYKQVNGDGEEVLVHDKKEGALVAIGEHIKVKRNFYEFVVKHLDKMNWWDS